MKLCKQMSLNDSQNRTRAKPASQHVKNERCSALHCCYAVNIFNGENYKLLQPPNKNRQIAKNVS